jgi:DNA-binding response OmpR family regulator
MEVILPEMNGFDVAIKLKNNPVTKNIPILFLTGLNTPDDLVRGYQVGAADFLSKPFNKEELLCRTTHQLILSRLAQLVSGPYDDVKKKNKILIIDDVISNVILAKILFTNEGYDVCTADSGQTGIEVAQEASPDIILLDVMMPDLNGFDVAKILKMNPKTWNIPILILTALNTPMDLLHGFQVGASDFLTKPFNKEEVVWRVKTLLKVSQSISKFLD